MATTITKPETLVGKRIRRQEDPRLITGTALYVDDIKMPGMHHACVVRSPHGAAKIKGIDTKAGARPLPGVVAVFTGADVEASGRGAVRARRCPDCAFRIIICWRRTASTSSAIRWPWWWPPTATSRATPPTWSKSTTKPLPAVADPEKAIAPGAPAGASRVARQRRVHLSPGRRRHRQGLRAKPTWSSSSASPASA